MMRVANLERIHVYTDPSNFCAEVSVANLGEGEIVSMFFQQRGLTHTDTGSVVLVRSLDNGRTWDPASKVVVMEHTEDAGYNAGAIACLSDGTLLVHANRWRYLDRGEIDWWRGRSVIEGVYLTRSTDKGHTWSAPERVNIAPMRTAFPRDSILELSDGTLLMPLHGFMFQPEIPEINNSAERERAYVLGSTDGGKQWDYWGTVAYDASGITHLQEPGLTQLPDGRVLALVRSQRFPRRVGPGEQMDVPSGYLFATVSEDSGISWSWPRNTGLWGYPADLITLPDGRVLATFGHRLEPRGVRVAVSGNGVDWDPEDTYALMEYNLDKVRPAFPIYPGEPITSYMMRGYLWHIGYPSSVLLDDGKVLTAYHLFNEEGRQYIEAAIYDVPV